MTHTLGPYLIRREIGRGGMGRVYEAFDPRLDRDVAIKILKGAADERELESFRREARVLSRLRHPGIVELYDVGEEAGEPYFVMELVRGAPLRDALPPRQAADVIRRAALAAQYAHEQGVLHRDIKPGNLLLGAVPKLADFGLARALEGKSGLSITGAALGTPAYMSPEQARGDWKRVDVRTDVWGLGASLYFAICGRPPFGGKTLEVTFHDVETRDPDPPGVDPALEAICLRCLEKEPARRYATARDLAADLERYLSGERIVARPPGFGERARKWIVRRRVGVIAASAAVLLGFGLWLGGYSRSGARAFLRSRAEAERAFAAGDWTKAEFESEQALRHSFDPEVATLLRISREKRQAREKHLRVLSRIAPMEAVIRDTLPFFYIEHIDIRRKLENIEEANAELERILAEEGGDPRGWAILGMGWYFVGDTARALEALGKAPDEPTAQYYLGRICLESGIAGLYATNEGPYENYDQSLRAWTERAIEHFDRAVEATDLERHVMAICREVAADRMNEALALCAEGRRRFPDGPGSEEFWAFEAYIRAGKGEACDRALERRPHYPWVLFIRGTYAFRRKGDLNGARADFDRAIAIHPRFADAYVNRAYVRGERGDLAGAVEDYRTAVRLRPDRQEFQFNLACQLRENGDLGAALECFDDILRTWPGYAQAYVNRGNTRKDRKDFDGALADFETALHLDRRLFRAWTNRAGERYRRGDFAGALGDYDQALSVKPDFAEARTGRGLLRHKMRDYDGALADFAEAIRVNPKSSIAYANRASTRLAKRDYAGAVADCDAAIAIDPNSEQPYFNRGVAHRRLRDLARAIADFDRAIRLQPSHPRAFSLRGLSRFEMGDARASIPDFDESIRIDPNEPNTWFYRGSSYRKLGEFGPAESDFGRAIALNPKFAEAYVNRGLCRTARDPDGALADLTEAIRLEPDFAEAYYNRSTLQKEPARALSDLDAAIRLKPTFVEALVQRGRMRLARRDAGAAKDFECALRHAPPDWPLRAEIEEALRRARGNE